MTKYKYYVRTESGRIYGSDYSQSDKGVFARSGDTALSRAEGIRAYRAQAVADLLARLKPGQTVYTCLRNVSKSGMQRSISLHIAERSKDHKGKMRERISDITYSVAIALDDRMDSHRGIVVNGAGMDMGFSLVYNLGATLWPKGTKKPHGRRNGEPDSTGGYALNKSWL